MSSESPSLQPSSRARFALVISLWGVSVLSMTATVLMVALPLMAKDLQAPMAAVNWVSLAPPLSVAVGTPLAGGLTDRLGAKRIWLTGLTLALLGFLGCGFAADLPTLIFARFLTGVGNALFMPAALAMISALYPPAARATPIGYWTSSVAISPMIGVVVGGYLTELLGWRMLFHAQWALGLPALLAGWFLPSAREASPTQRSFDWGGAFAAAVAASALLCLFSRIGNPLSAATLAVLATISLVLIERRAQAPVFPPALLAIPAVRQALLSRFTMSFTYMGSFMILPYLMSQLWKQTPSQVALAISIRPLAMAFAGAMVGKLARQLGTATLTVRGAWLVLLSSIAFAAMGAGASVLDQTLLALGLALAGFGLGMGSSGTAASVTSRVEVSQLGTVSGLMTLTSTLANALGMAGMFALVEVSGGVERIEAYRRSNLGGAAVAAVALVAGYAMRRHQAAER